MGIHQSNEHNTWPNCLIVGLLVLGLLGLPYRLIVSGDPPTLAYSLGEF